MNKSNPFNNIETANQLSDCAHGNIKKVQVLSTLALEKKYDLPCGCASVALKDLLENYACERCGATR
jgi:hypothetical protein